MLDCPTFNSVDLLTPRERQVVALVSQGMTNREIGEKQAICEGTVKNHLRAIFEKLRVESRLELALYAVHNGLLIELIGDQFLGRQGVNPERRAK